MPVQILVLMVVAYQPETLIPTVKLAMADSNLLYGPNISFSYAFFNNSNMDTCDEIETEVLPFLANFYYNQRQNGTYTFSQKNRDARFVKRQFFLNIWLKTNRFQVAFWRKYVAIMGTFHSVNKNV
ncbi:hypothetical protein BV898_19488 [Hypsibius exemplaris]|uniref:Uncharacterized protein n=1 Tax=Hypsibius exemplaris TaxID=2072580 RepID=A0A9X6NS97_HYPEX|nr:hypothetical protein BV898_19488 [Hypsibius exemplaris]